MTIYNTLAIPALIYESKIWTLIQHDKSRLKASEIKFLRRTVGYTLLDHEKNEDILQELNITPVLEKITKYRHNWVKHIRCMNNLRFPKALIEYHPRGRRHPGRPLKRLLDGVQIETETGHMGLIS
jgi:ABC-type ATPase involved in cell division